LLCCVRMLGIGHDLHPTVLDAGLLSEYLTLEQDDQSTTAKLSLKKTLVQVYVVLRRAQRKWFQNPQKPPII
jgi:hypothetical protein